MRTVRDLVENENLGKLITAKRSFDRASQLFDEVFSEDGAPCDVEPVQEEFFNTLAECERCLERLMGSVVFNDLFYSEQYERLRNVKERPITSVKS